MTEVLLIDGEAVELYADILSGVAAALVDGDRDLALERLAPIAGQRWFGTLKLDGQQLPDGDFKRVPIKNRDRAQAMIRDDFRCQACGGPVVPRCVLVALSDVFPEALSYHRNYKRGEIHPVYLALAAEADHVLPSSLGGKSELDNLRTVHAFCNTQRGNALLEDLGLDEAEAAGLVAEWDGLVPAYASVVAAAGALSPSRTTYHRAWMRDFGITQPAIHQTT